MSAHGTEPSRALATEQTPLLRDADPTNSGSGEGQPEPEDPSTRELIIVLGAIWVGVFLAALGKLHYFQGIFVLMANQQISRYNHCRNAIGAHLILLQLILALVMACNLLSDLECRLSTS